MIVRLFGSHADNRTAYADKLQSHKRSLFYWTKEGSGDLLGPMDALLYDAAKIWADILDRRVEDLAGRPLPRWLVRDCPEYLTSPTYACTLIATEQIAPQVRRYVH
jgi:hypothetical protein